MKLTEAEKNSALWQKISNYLSERLNSLRVYNDGDINILTDVQTATVRGQIKEVKSFQAMATRPENMDSDE